MVVNDNEKYVRIKAKDVRIKEKRLEIPDKPGFYKWWAPKKAIKLLLDSQYIEDKYLSELLPELEITEFNGTTYYYIYVGIAVKESIRSRLNWHVNQENTGSSIKSGFLSTLRQSISSLLSGDQSDSNATNDLIDMLMIEYETFDLPIRSQEAKKKIEQIENAEIKKHLLPINLRGNKNPKIKKFSRELRTARKRAKAKALGK